MIRNLTRNRPLALRPYYAVCFADRLRGMIARSFDGFDAMVFDGCGAIHTMFMREAIDAVFYDAGHRVVGVRRGLRPWRPMLRCGGARGVIELPCGRIAESGLELGDVLDLNAEPVESAAKRYIDNGVALAAAGGAPTALAVDGGGGDDGTRGKDGRSQGL
jgi:uncharacterized membrane protein (UPF0127 family)